MSKWKSTRRKCTKIRCDNDNGESMEFEVCVKNGKFSKCKKI